MKPELNAKNPKKKKSSMLNLSNLSVLGEIIERFKRPDIAQLLILFFAVITVSVIASWPNNPQQPNNSWSVLAQSKLALLILFATLFGGLSRPAREKLITLLALTCFHLFSLPLDTATYAASFPEVNVIWALCLPLVALFSYFMLANFLSSILNKLGLHLLALPCSVALPVVAVFADIRLGINLFNPFNSISHMSLPYIGLNLAIGFIGLIILVRQVLKKS